MVRDQRDPDRSADRKKNTLARQPRLDRFRAMPICPFAGRWRPALASSCGRAVQEAAQNHHLTVGRAGSAWGDGACPSLSHCSCRLRLGGQVMLYIEESSLPPARTRVRPRGRTPQRPMEIEQRSPGSLRAYANNPAYTFASANQQDRIIDTGVRLSLPHRGRARRDDHRRRGTGRRRATIRAGLDPRRSLSNICRRRKSGLFGLRTTSSLKGPHGTGKSFRSRSNTSGCPVSISSCWALRPEKSMRCILTWISVAVGPSRRLLHHPWTL